MENRKEALLEYKKLIESKKTLPETELTKKLKEQIRKDLYVPDFKLKSPMTI